MTEKKLKLCGRCAALLMEAYEMQKVEARVDMKVLCYNCGKRRYGAIYQIDKKKRR